MHMGTLQRNRVLTSLQATAGLMHVHHRQLIAGL